jgi:hypothetical protein
MGLREVTNMPRQPYKCPLCGENACWGIDCNECKFGSDYDCEGIVPCDCNGLNYITEIQRNDLRNRLKWINLAVTGLLTCDPVAPMNTNVLEYIEERSKI